MMAAPPLMPRRASRAVLAMASTCPSPMVSEKPAFLKMRAPERASRATSFSRPIRCFRSIVTPLGTISPAAEDRDVLLHLGTRRRVRGRELEVALVRFDRLLVLV